MGQTWGRSGIASTAASPGGSAPLPSPPSKQQRKRQRKRLRGGATAGTVPSSILLLGASISCHGASGSVRSLIPPQHGLNWRHLKASTESANETGADSSATLPPHPFSTATPWALHPSHGRRPSPGRTEQGTGPLLPRAPSTQLAPSADTLLGRILPKTTRSEHLCRPRRLARLSPARSLTL